LESSGIQKEREAEENVVKDNKRIRSTRRSWNEVKRMAGDCNAWKLFMDVLCCTRSKKI
jgi:hypothetical protein